jgi:DNA-binding CsgD family transcriptional regulator
MINYLIAILFVLTVAITTGSILISVHLRNTYKADFFPALVFFQVFYFTFGFYAIWGQFIVSSFLSPFVTPRLLGKITDLTLLLGLPFLALGSLMFLRLSREISGRKTGKLFALWFLLLNTFLLFGIGYVFVKYQNIKTFTVVKYYYILFNLVFTVYGSYNLISVKKGQNKLLPVDLKNLVFGLLSLMLIQNGILLFYKGNIYIALLFILIYFISSGLLPVFLRYKADLSVLLPKGESTESFGKFCEKFEISRRETEIIHEICRGLTNQQIADKLFISLQTVKDHTHRIYFKTNSNSRAQLMKMVNDSAKDFNA